MAALAVAGLGVTFVTFDRTAAPPAGPSGPPPPPPWTTPQLATLADAIDAAAAEGLRPADYGAAVVRRAATLGWRGAPTDAFATAEALALAHDYAAGRIRNRARFGWHVEAPVPDPATLEPQLRAAREEGRLGDWFAGLLPRSPDYRALHDALAATSPGAARDRIRVNMERWRWLPRGWGAPDRLYVNLPTYRLEVRRGGETVASHRVVIGAPETPTPTLSATVARVVVNPSWIVPPSIVRSAHLRPSAAYAFTTRPDGSVRVRRRPGPGNSLGRVKIEMPNSMAIYLHDTPAKALFDRPARAYSHGCVRVQGVDALAATLLDGTPRLAAAFAGTATRSFPVKAGWPVDLVYLTVVPGADGGVVALGDPYALDAPMAAALDGRRVVMPVRTIAALP